MTCIASLAVCAFLFVLLFISRTGLAPQGSVQHRAPAGLKEEIDRVNAEIERIFGEALAQLPSIPVDAFPSC